ncbi:intracellular multiplication protein IcmK [Gammaproteobacteria bacterium]
MEIGCLSFMKIFLTILSVLFVFCQSSFALTARDKRDQADAQKKMDQLQQVLAKAAKSNELPGSANITATSSLSSDLLPPSKSDQANALRQAQAFGVSSSTQNKAADIASVPATADVPQPSLYDQAFSGVVGQLLPMTPDQVVKLREVFTASQQAAANPPGVPPRPTSTSLLVNLSPQAVAPVIRLGAGYITSLVFIDATGQPWPIAAYSVGDPASFNIQWDRKGNTMLVQSATFYKRSNLAVILRDLNTPVMITLISGQEAVDYRVDLRIPGVGPNAVFIQNGIPDAVNPILFDVLNGIPPRGSKELKVSGGGVTQAWLLNKKLYLRTNLTVTSPGWQATMSSIDGTHAYQLQPSPVILALQNGKDKILTLTIEGLE